MIKLVQQLVQYVGWIDFRNSSPQSTIGWIS